MKAPRFDPAAIVRVLNDHGVRYVVIGAFAAISQQAPIPLTRDIDVTPGDDRDNLSRLSAALDELGARVRTAGEPGGLPFAHDAASLARAGMWNLTCSVGDFDVTFRPSGVPGGYRELKRRAHTVEVSGVEVMVADLADVIRSKEAAGRAKDLRVLPALYRHLADRDSRDTRGTRGTRGAQD